MLLAQPGGHLPIRTDLERSARVFQRQDAQRVAWSSEPIAERVALRRWLPGRKPAHLPCHQLLGGGSSPYDPELHASSGLVPAQR
jgi:hypothetical protein